MRVIHIGHAPVPFHHPNFGDIYTHPGSWVVNLCRGQSRLPELDIELVTQVPGAKCYFRDDSNGFPIHYLPAPKRLRAVSLFYFDIQRISSFVKMLKPDIVHAHGAEESYLLSAQATRLPYIFTAQGCFFIINREFPPRFISRAKIVEFTERRGLCKTRHAIAKSEYVANELKNYFPHINIYKIPNTFDERLLNISLDRPRQEGSLSFVGTIVERKGLHLLADAIEAMKEESNYLMPPIMLHIFGNRKTPSSYEQFVIARLQNLLGEKLVLHGTIPPMEVAESLSRIEVMVAPSIEEMFGNQFIEALLVGSETIVTDDTAMAENARKLNAGTIIPQKDSKALSRALRAALSLEKDIKEKKRIRQKLVELMGPESVAKKHLQVYKNVLGEDC